jgi:hypothetical protein
MKNRFAISENDRRSILSLHGLLIESVETYKFFGKVTNEIDDPVGYCNVVFIDENKKPLKGSTITDYDGKYSTEIDLDNTKKYKIKITSSEITEQEIEIDLTKKEQEINFKANSKLRNLESMEIEEKGLFGCVFNLRLLDAGNNPINDALVNLSVSGKPIDYSILKYTDEGFSYDDKTKKTSNGNLKNIFIDSTKYPEFKYTNNELCVEKENVTLEINYLGRKKSQDLSLCKTNVKFQPTTAGTIDNTKLFRIKQDQTFNLNLNLGKDKLQFYTFNTRTKKAAGGIKFDVYNDISKKQYLGSFVTEKNGAVEVFVGADKYGVFRITKDQNEFTPKQFDKKELFIYSFSPGYEEFFKKYTENFPGNGSLVSIQILVESPQGQQKEEDNTDFDKKSGRYVFYGRSEKKYKTKEEAIQDAKRDAFDQFLKKSKRYKDNEDLIGKIPEGGKLKVLRNNDDGTFTAIVKFRRKELRNFAKNFQPEPKPEPVVPKEDIEFENILISEATKTDNVLIFVLGKESNTSNELYDKITFDVDLVNYINDNYTNIRVYNDKEDINYYEVVNNYKVSGIPTVILDTTDKKPYHFNNFKGDIYTQMKNYFKV